MSKKTEKVISESLMRNANKKQQQKQYKQVKDAGGDIGMRVRKDEKTKEDKMPNAIYMDNPWGSSRNIQTYEDFQMKETEKLDEAGLPTAKGAKQMKSFMKKATKGKKKGKKERGVKDLTNVSVISTYESSKYKYVIKTYNGEELDNEEIVYLEQPDLSTYDDEVPMTLGSNQELIELVDDEDYIQENKQENKKVISTFESWKGAFKGMNNPTRLEDFYMWLDRDKIDLNDDSWVRGTKEDFERPMFKNLPDHKDRYPYDVLRSGKFLETKDGKIVGQIDVLKGKVVVLDIIDENNEHQYIEYDVVKLVKKLKDKELKINSNETTKNVKINTPWGKITQKENE